jgi:alkanesulfonate monooxygenase SsuD/methylene tetrahydromethanopterin reductase-like flavin-dependent oxidoreductase (luciferase family)
VLAILAGSKVKYLPFPGRPHDHPTKLGGTPQQIEDDCRRFQALGCAGVDLLAYRATEADPLDLVRAARRGIQGTLLVAGSVQRADQIRALAAAGADAFTIGSAALDGSFAPRMGSLRSQLRAVLDACR